MNKILWLVLDTIREECTKRDYCEGCPCAGMYLQQGLRRYYCTIDEVPSRWQTGIIRENIEEMEDNE